MSDSIPWQDRAVRILIPMAVAAMLTACGGVPIAPAASPTVTPSTGPTQPDPGESILSATPTVLEASVTPSLTPIPFSDEGPWPVSFSSSDGVTLHGTLYGQGTTAVILTPMYLGTQDEWEPFARQAAAQGVRVLTFDYRGYGDSDGERNPATTPTDVSAAIAFMREHDFSPIVLVGAGLGGSASIRGAVQDGNIAGVAVISAPRIFPPDKPEALEVTDADLTALSMPTLWIATRNDLTQNVEEMQALATGPDKVLWIYEGSGVSGTFIFDGPDGPDLTRRLLEFISRVAGPSAQ